MNFNRLIYDRLGITLKMACLMLFLNSLCVWGQESKAPSAVLEQRIHELRKEAKFLDALEVAKELLTLRQTDKEAKPYQIADAERLVADLEYITHLTQVEQARLARADELAEQADEQYDKGDYTKAELLQREVLSIRRELLGSAHLDVASSLNDLALVLHYTGDYDGAEPLYREALAIRRKILGSEHPDVATSLDNLAYLLQHRADFEEAESLHLEAFAVRCKLLGNEHPDVAESLNNLAELYQIKGDYARAEPLYREALAISRKFLGNDHPDIATSLSNLGLLLKYKGDYEGAELLQREALSMYRRLFGNEHPYIATSLNNLAALLRDKGDYAQAEPLQREALAMFRELLNNEHIFVAKGLTNLALILQYKGDYAGAETLYREALAMGRKLFGNEHPYVARSLNDLAVLLEAKGEFQMAEPLQYEAVSLVRKLLGDNHPQLAVSLTNLGKLLQAENNYAAAESVFVEAAEVYEAARLRAGPGLARSTFQSSPYSGLSCVRLHLGKTIEAWLAAERDLGRVLADLLVAAEQRRLSLTEVAVDDSLKQLLGTLERKLAAYQKAAESDTTNEMDKRFQETRNQLLKTEAQWSNFQREMVAKHPISEGQAYSLERVQTTLDEHTAIVGWLDVEEREGETISWAYIIRNNGPVVWNRVGSSGEKTESSFDRHDVFRSALAVFNKSQVEVREAAAELWKERFSPFYDELEEVENLYVIPSGSMLGVPVETLVDDKNVLVGDRFVVSYVPSATIHTWLAERPHARRQGALGAALLIGDPPYNTDHLSPPDEQLGLVAARSAKEDSALYRGAFAGNKEELAKLPRLPGSRQEVNAISRMFPVANSLIGVKATEQELVRLAESVELRQYNVLHFAAHALADDKNPERSAFILSQVDLPDALEAALSGERIYDGMITVKEILHEWKLNADLVTLSGCQTALGKAVAGEGYIGLAHAFLQVGARSLLVSLWDVEDRATSLLMQRFYENYTGSYEDKRGNRRGEAMTKAQALAEAKRWLRTYTDPTEWEPPFAHPYYWAGFILIGDPF
jgi:CHAT domain-containing protein/Flp pilus assembly protein TadD